MRRRKVAGLLALALGLLGAGGGRADLVFECRRLEIPGRGPFGVAVGDWNGDGIPDLATSDARSGTLSVLLGLGAGAFRARRPVSVGAVPRGLAAADVNGDQRLDLAVAHARPDETWLLLGNGAGAFHLAGSYRSGESPFDVALRDVNGDGSVDLVVANESNGPLSSRGGVLAVHLGDGKGRFSEPALLRGGRHPASLAIADLDARHGPDVVAVNWLSETLSLFLQGPEGTFGPVREIATELAKPYGLLAGDLDGDGTIDLATTGLVGGVHIVYGEGKGAFSKGQILECGAGTRWVGGADLDEDGRLDLFTADTHAGAISLIRNLGPRRYAPAQALVSGRMPRMVRAADLDGDGRMDLVVANQGEDDLTLFLQRDSGKGRRCPEPNGEGRPSTNSSPSRLRPPADG